MADRTQFEKRVIRRDSQTKRLKKELKRAHAANQALMAQIADKQEDFPFHEPADVLKAVVDGINAMTGGQLDVTVRSNPRVAFAATVKELTRARGEHLAEGAKLDRFVAGPRLPREHADEALKLMKTLNSLLNEKPTVEEVLGSSIE